MNENKKAGWAEFTIHQSVEELLQYGPSLELYISKPGDIGSTMHVFAQIDTGCSHTAISTDIADRLSLEFKEARTVHQAGRAGVSAGMATVMLAHELFETQMQVAIISTLHPPHDVLIGRNLLADSRLDIDFTSGRSTLHVRYS